MKKLLQITIILGVLLGVVYGGIGLLAKRGSTPSVTPLGPTSYKDSTITIEGESVALVHGEYQTPTVSEGQPQTVIHYFGNEAEGDLNGDGVSDAAFLITKDNRGSGTFYYVVVALKLPSGYFGTNAVFLGDRIAPQSTQIKDGQLIVNYAERKEGEPMTAQPSVGVSKYFKIDETALLPDMAHAGLGERCGGNMTTARACGSGMHCAVSSESMLPVGDVGGTCVKN